ncbi:MAG: 23S rRNA (pseudouridine(1915)-N(3))-methyltransferase RlmH [Candidatus Parcubacteria bacterium]|nr:23S rRNA (pseudouridine(1915)-N(3))-methyltransferase RlmH [Candidatus Parcubacteria bacterium]
MKIKIITISKTKSEYSEAEAEFLKRLTKYAQVEILNLKEEPITKNRDIDEIMAKEGDRILKSLDKDYYNIALHVMGKEVTSVELSNLIKEIKDFKGGKLCFVIGGPLGLAQEVLAKVDLALSFSRMTFTHQLIRLILLEQIYRSFEIIKGSGYHK